MTFITIYFQIKHYYYDCDYFLNSLLLNIYILLRWYKRQRQLNTRTATTKKNCPLFYHFFFFLCAQHSDTFVG